MENFLDYFNKMKIGEKVYGSLVLISDERRRVHGCLYKDSPTECYFLHEDSFYDGTRPKRLATTGYSWSLPPESDKVNQDCENFSFQVDISYIDIEIHLLLQQAESKLKSRTNLLTPKT